MGIQLIRGNELQRNDLCMCGSGLKFKHCHGDPTKQQLCNHELNRFMQTLIIVEQIKHGIRCGHGTLKTEHCPSCKVDEKKPSIILGDN